MSKNNNIWKTIEDELDERLKLKELASIATQKTVPVHKHSIWYYFGGISLFFFIIQMITGMLLLFHYEPGLTTSYASVNKIFTKVDFGSIIRSFHSWSANLMVGSVLVHMFSTYFMKAYQKPRELTWLSGAGLLFLTVVFGFTGYLLPWDEIAYSATKVGLNIAEATPWLMNEETKLWFWPGKLLADLLRGGPEITSLTIQRFASIHYVVLPWVFAGLLGFHLLLIQLHGNTIPQKIKESKQYRNIPFFPNFFYEDLFAWLLTFNLLAVLAIVWPWGLGIEADVLAPAPTGIHPEWYFMAPFEILKWMPPSLGAMNGEFLGIILFGGASVLLFGVPFWNTKESEGKIGRFATYFGVFAIIGLILLTISAYWCLDGNEVCVRMHDFLPWIVRGFK